MTQAETIGFKATSVAGIIVTIVMGFSGVMAMHSAGIKSANEFTIEKYRDSKEYTNLRVDPLEKRLDTFEKATEKKISELQSK